MTPDQRKRLTWEDATERFLDIAELKADERPGVLEAAVDKLAWAAHNTLTGGQEIGHLEGLLGDLCWAGMQIACLGDQHAGSEGSCWQTSVCGGVFR